MSENSRFKAIAKFCQSENSPIHYYKMKFFDEFDNDFVNWLYYDGNIQNLLDLKVENLENSPKIEMYTLENCGYCTKAKEHLQNLGISFVEYNHNRGEFAIDELRERMNTTENSISAPVIFINEEYIGGYSELVERF